MKKSIIVKLAVFAVAFMTAGCSDEWIKKDDIFGPAGADSSKDAAVCSLYFSGYDSAITDPAKDRRAYYKVFIDKTEAGRTTTGLESQKKFFETKVSVNRHLITVQKWILNEKTGAYEKLNNVNQPHPSYCYFDIKGKGSINIQLEVLADNRAVFTVSE